MYMSVFLSHPPLPPHTPHFLPPLPGCPGAGEGVDCGEHVQQRLEEPSVCPLSRPRQQNLLPLHVQRPQEEMAKTGIVVTESHTLRIRLYSYEICTHLRTKFGGDEHSRRGGKWVKLTMSNAKYAKFAE